MKKRTTLISVIVVVLILTTMIIFAAGSEDDPLITKSYLEAELEKINAHTDESINALRVELKDYFETLSGNSGQGQTGGEDDPTPNTETGLKFKPVKIEKEKSIFFEEGSEFILRSGNAKIIDPTGNGLPDLTNGSNLQDNVPLPLNHYILSPRDDGRGISAESQIWIMIKGGYRIK